MNHITPYNRCFGCGVCIAACPKNAITMVLNEEGFYVPVIEEVKCVNCGICISVCAFNNENTLTKNTPINYYSAWSNSSENRKKTSSGGVVYEIALKMLKEGYKFCGVRYNNDKQRAEHYIATSESEIKASQKSKYLQSYSMEGFSQLNSHEKFVVVGTPCQIDSIRRLIEKRKIEDNFVLIDFFCHGVPSYNLWKSYLKFTGLSDIKSVSFRSKEDGWQESTYIIISSKLRTWKSKLIEGDLFYKFFLENRCLNKACYDDCKYKTINSYADIRVGDMWGKKYSTNQDGISAVLTFTEKGEEIVRSLSVCSIQEESLEDVLGSQMRKNARRPLSYNYVVKSLIEGKSLKFINNIATLIEFPNRLVKRLTYIVKRIKQLFVR